MYGLQGSIVDVILSKAEQILDIHKMFQIELADKVKNWDKEEEIGTCFIGFVSETSNMNKLFDSNLSLAVIFPLQICHFYQDVWPWIRFNTSYKLTRQTKDGKDGNNRNNGINSILKASYLNRFPLQQIALSV